MSFATGVNKPYNTRKTKTCRKPYKNSVHKKALLTIHKHLNIHTHRKMTIM